MCKCANRSPALLLCQVQLEPYSKVEPGGFRHEKVSAHGHLARSVSEEKTMSSGENISPTAQELKQALKAFRKRLKLTQLDEESKLGGGPLSHNRARIVAISPPNQFAPAVWEELVKQGRLKKAGGGTYELVEQ
jgi:hypothetical protein